MISSPRLNFILKENLKKYLLGIKKRMKINCEEEAHYHGCHSDFMNLKKEALLFLFLNPFMLEGSLF